MIAFIDLETSGLKPGDGCILEAALVITDDNLDEVFEQDWLINPFVSPTKWDVFVYDMHQRSGLLGLCLNSNLNCAHVSNAMVKVIDEFASGAPLGGSTVHFDRAWLDRHMPDVTKALGYRNIDVSSVKELVNRWYPSLASARPVADIKPHRALADIKASIEELRWYRDNTFIPRIAGVNG